MKLSLNKAAQHYKVSKSTLSDALNTGRLSAEKNAKGRWEIDPSEMDRVFPLNTENHSKVRTPNAPLDTAANTDLRIEIAELKAALNAEKRLTESQSDQIGDLRERLDREGEERRSLTAMLTDQREGQGEHDPEPVVITKFTMNPFKSGKTA